MDQSKVFVWTSELDRPGRRRFRIDRPIHRCTHGPDTRLDSPSVFRTVRFTHTLPVPPVFDEFT